MLIPVLWVLVARRGDTEPLDMLPAMRLLVDTALVLFAPPGSNGLLDEYKHRHVVLLYVASALMTAVWAVRLAGPRPGRLAAMGAAGATMGAVMLVAGRPVGAPDTEAMPWAVRFHRICAIPGMVEAGPGLAGRAAAGDVLAADTAAGMAFRAPLEELLALSGMPAYVSRGRLKTLRSDCHSDGVASRETILARVDGADEWACARAYLRSAGIRCFTALTAPGWDPTRKEAAFAKGDVAIYDAGSGSVASDRWAQRRAGAPAQDHEPERRLHPLPLTLHDGSRTGQYRGVPRTGTSRRRRCAFTEKCHDWPRRYSGGPCCLLTPSCTAALEMSVLLPDLEPGDEVITPSCTFVSTANAFVLRGAIPRCVDIRPDTLNLDEGQVSEATGPRTRAIGPVHYAGVACDTDTLMEIAAQNGLAVVKDAAQGVMAG